MIKIKRKKKNFLNDRHEWNVARKFTHQVKSTSHHMEANRGKKKSHILADSHGFYVTMATAQWNNSSFFFMKKDSVECHISSVFFQLKPLMPQEESLLLKTFNKWQFIAISLHLRKHCLGSPSPLIHMFVLFPFFVWLETLIFPHHIL